jgi:hypothetical protein
LLCILIWYGIKGIFLFGLFKKENHKLFCHIDIIHEIPIQNSKIAGSWGLSLFTESYKLTENRNKNQT